MKEASIEPGTYNADTLFDAELAVVQMATSSFQKILAPVIGSTTLKEMTKLTLWRPECRPYRPNTIRPLQTLGQTTRLTEANDVGALRLTYVYERKGDSSHTQPTTTLASARSDRMHIFSNAAMERFLKEQQLSRVLPATHTQEDREECRMLIWSPRIHNEAYKKLTRMVSASTYLARLLLPPRIGVPAISELKELSGKEIDEDHAEGRMGKVKSANVRDQAPGSVKNVWSSVNRWQAQHAIGKYS
ncbi:hypothetical protein PHPALM_30493 [Phytophthora palmivora]|uniref:Uncharacterized protein n=1 Tax=Phytophthora palmivora TaxID=4796 RepID=A0A2P4X511_9STRA|nr:hypothetical protein PHPALM_30493 [Phytophthora palmivora]